MHGFRGRSGRPLPPPAAPQHRRQAEPMRGDQRSRAQNAVRGAEQPGVHAGRGRDDLLGAGQIVVGGDRPAQRQVTMPPPVHADLMAGVGDVGRQPRRLRHLRAEQEKRGPHAPVCQQLDEERGRCRVGAIVEGQRDVVGPDLPGQQRKQRHPDGAQRRHSRTRVGHRQASGRHEEPTAQRQARPAVGRMRGI